MIRLILLDTVCDLGTVGDVVSVRPGYARNYLIPRKFAVVATKFAIDRLSSSQEQIQKDRELSSQKEVDLYGKLEEISGKVRIFVNSVMDGKFFGSVSVQDFMQAVSDLGVKLDRKQVYFSGKKIKSVGSYEALVRVGKDRSISVSFSVISNIHSSEEQSG